MIMVLMNDCRSDVLPVNNSDSDYCFHFSTFKLICSGGAHFAAVLIYCRLTIGTDY